MAPTAWLGDLVFGISQTPQVWLDHQVGEDGGTLVFNWDMVEALFPVGMIDAMFATYCRRLTSLATGDPAWSAPARALIPEEQVRLQATMNATAAPVPESTLPALVADQVTQRPDAPAVITPARTLTYRELGAAADAVARWLRAHRAQPNHLVAVVMEKGWEQVAAVVGVGRAAAAYLPIEADVPAHRLARLLAQGEATLVLTQSWLIDTLVWPPGLTLLAVDGLDTSSVADGGPPPATPRGDDLAYVIFTSGSTGTPKGVALTHRAVVNTLLDVNARWAIGPADRLLALSALSFDLSVYDIFGTLAAGGAVVFPAADGRRDPAHWLERLTDARVTIWNTVPALMQLLVEAAEAGGTSLPDSVRLVLLSGDWIPVRLPDRIRALAPGAQVISLGGATEAAIWSIYYPVDAVDSSWPSIPYGRPLANQTWQVLHADWTPCPVWVPGELYIGGAGLAQGYWRDPERTRERFVTHPITRERLYRTGDWGRYHPDGSIEFLGRDDLQVKVQGHRIELGEIEAALLQQPAVAQAVAAVDGERMGDRRLIAGIVGRDATPPDPAALRAALQTTLPAYMVPARIHILSALPLTANGKVDRQALVSLPSLGHIAPGAASGVAAGSSLKNPSSIGDRIEGLVAGVLKVERVERDADLFALGLTSIDMMRLANSLEQTFAFRPRMADLFTLTNVAALTSYYERRLEDRRDGTPAAPAPPDPGARESFKPEHRGLRALAGRFPPLGLPRSATEPTTAHERRSRRSFGVDPMTVEALAGLLDCLSEHQAGGQRRRRYGSAGGLYPVQIYAHLRPRRVDGLAAGTYYYHPADHVLLPLTPDVDLNGSVHAVINRPLFDQSAFSLFLVGEMRAIEPVYAERARDFALIEAGLIAQLLETTAGAHHIGLCQIGLIDFDAIRGLFLLDESHLFLHALLGGPIAPVVETWEEGTL
jgi:amino acid adenylation domain-containing protein